MMEPTSRAPSSRTQVKRLPERGRYEPATVHAILDAGFLCHVGFIAPEGHPVVIPTAYGRRGDYLYLHGSAASRMLRTLREGVELCCTITHLDGLVLARSVFNHSMNYRSVMIFGRGRVLSSEAEKLAAMEVISNQIAPGRWEAARRPSEQELKATLVLELPLGEASAKIRSGPPHDNAEDYALPVWAGVVPIALRYGKPEADPKLAGDIQLPEALLGGRGRCPEGT